MHPQSAYSNNHFHRHIRNSSIHGMSILCKCLSSYLYQHQIVTKIVKITTSQIYAIETTPNIVLSQGTSTVYATSTITTANGTLPTGQGWTQGLYCQQYAYWNGMALQDPRDGVIGSFLCNGTRPTFNGLRTEGCTTVTDCMFSCGEYAGGCIGIQFDADTNICTLINGTSLPLIATDSCGVPVANQDSVVAAYMGIDGAC